MKQEDIKKNNYKIGVLKRQFKMGKGDFEPGTLINKAKEAPTKVVAEVKRTGTMGLI